MRIDQCCRNDKLICKTQKCLCIFRIRKVPKKTIKKKPEIQESSSNKPLKLFLLLVLNLAFFFFSKAFRNLPSNILLHSWCDFQRDWIAQLKTYIKCGICWNTLSIHTVFCTLYWFYRGLGLRDLQLEWCTRDCTALIALLYSFEKCFYAALLFKIPFESEVKMFYKRFKLLTEICFVRDIFIYKSQLIKT